MCRCSYMQAHQSTRLAATCLFVVWCAAPGLAQRASSAEATARRHTNALRQAILAAEDGRAEGDAALAPLREGLKAEPSVQVLAVRALGRLERASLVPDIAPLLESRAVAVRIEAANALGQAVVDGEPGAATAPLIARALVEADPRVLGAVARTLGRLPYEREDQIREAERAMLDIAQRTAQHADTTLLAGVAHGLEALARRSAKLALLSPASQALLRGLARHGLDGEPARIEAAPAAERNEVASQAPVRRLAVAALVALRESNAPLLLQILRDPDEQVRRLAVIWLGAAEDVALRDAAFDEMLRDTSPMVRYEALRVSARVRRAATARATPTPSGGGRAERTGSPTGEGRADTAMDPASSACAHELAALDDAGPHVVLLGIDLLGSCVDRREATDRLTTIVSALASEPVAPAARVAPGAGERRAVAPLDRQRRPRMGQAWHKPAHALVALTRLAPDRASGWLAHGAGHPIWQVRMYAARAAGIAKDRDTLDALAVDSDDNVRHAAIEALQALVGHDADAQYLAALERSDYQLLRTAARALAGTAQKAEAAARLSKAFIRVSAARRETSRDARVALLDRLEETGANVEGIADALQPFLSDFDPLVASRVAALLTTWTGTRHIASPVPLTPARVPSPGEIARLARSRAEVRMARGGTFTLALRPDVAPTNVARFVRLARAGYFNGLTFHRVEPNFVVQGGSPRANEYAGNGPYTRDELDLTSNVRGTVGVSTRGRDTGDGQIYINLVDNPRLDHNYTVFAEILDGLSIVDGLLEGDVIARVVLREGR
jgi:cyclophilin family peptidyl-prolyl cis-trans isomerase/HEAT repeat protein